MTARRAFAIALTTLALAACGGGQRHEEPPPSAPEPSTPPGQTTPPDEGAMPPSEGTTPEGGGTGTGEGTTTPPGAQGMMCPAGIPGTQVAVEDTADGVAIRFTNPTQTEQVRRLTENLAEAQDISRVGGGGHHAMHHPEITPHTARVQNIDDGALLVLTPVSGRDLNKLRDETRTMANRMQTGDCPMMHEGGMGGGMGQPGPMEEEENLEVPGAGE